MNDIRRTILWVIFGFSLVMLWDQWQLHNGRKPTFFPSATPTVAQVERPVGAASVPSGVPVAAGSAAANPAAIATAAASDVQSQAVPRELVEAQTDVYKLSFDTEGGSLVRAEFLQHVDMIDKTRKFVLFDNNVGRLYMAQTGLISAAGGAAFPTHKTPMTLAPGARSLADGANTLDLRFESAEVGGVKLIKTYTLTRGSYAVSVKHEVLNVGTSPVAPQLYLQLVRDGNKPPGESSFYSTFTGPAIYTQAKKYQKVEFTDIEKGKVDIEKSASNGYVAMVQHYFASAWLLGDGQQRDLFMRKNKVWEHGGQPEISGWPARGLTWIAGPGLSRATPPCCTC